MIELTQRIRLAALMCAAALLLLLFITPQASAVSNPPDLTNTLWNWTDENISLALTFTQGKPETKALSAILKGWGKDPVELRGEYSDAASELRLRMTGSSKGETIALDVKYIPADGEQRPYLYGEFSAGSNQFSVYARCDKGCADTSPKGDELIDSARAARVENDLVGEWQDTSEAIGFKEYWSIKLSGEAWQISGELVRAGEVVGVFHAENVVFDRRKGVLHFQQLFDQKPDDSWGASYDIEATAQGDTLKIKVRGVEATLTRAPNSSKQ
jgi:hypothetical protein